MVPFPWSALLCMSRLVVCTPKEVGLTMQWLGFYWILFKNGCSWAMMFKNTECWSLIAHSTVRLCDVWFLARPLLEPQEIRNSTTAWTVGRVRKGVLLLGAKHCRTEANCLIRPWNTSSSSQLHRKEKQRRGLELPWQQLAAWHWPGPGWSPRGANISGSPRRACWYELSWSVFIRYLSGLLFLELKKTIREKDSGKFRRKGEKHDGVRSKMDLLRSGTGLSYKDISDFPSAFQQRCVWVPAHVCLCVSMHMNTQVQVLSVYMHVKHRHEHQVSPLLGFHVYFWDNFS